MNKLARRSWSWTCAHCLKGQRRTNSSAAASAAAQDPRAFHDSFAATQGRSQADDAVLRDVFNNQHFWRDFSSLAKKGSGLIGNQYLTTPRGFHRFAETSLQQCKKIVDKALVASTVTELKSLPQELDRLSDLLCRVIDLSDFIRSIHPDQNMAAAATASYSMMYQYMNELNTTTGLNQQLQRAISNPEVSSQWNQEEAIVAQILMKDFAKSGIDLPAAQREKFVSLSNEIASVGTDFINNMDHAVPGVTVSKSQLHGVEPTFLQRMSSWKKSQIPPYSNASRLVQAQAHDSSIRKQMYIADRTASRQTIARLERLLSLRAQLATLTGQESYSHMTLADKMSKRPDAVMKFLQSLNQNNKFLVEGELSKLLQIKRMADPDATKVAAWERSYLLNQYSQVQGNRVQRTSKSRLRESRNAYFAIGHVIQGLSSLFESLYGVRLVPKETQLGETWHPDVRRLDVYTEAHQHIATMYCDLFSRPGKLPNPAHFTLVCSRQISAAEIEEAHSTGEPLNNGMPTYTTPDPYTGLSSHFQTPVIALVCDFTDSSTSYEPTLLSPNSVTTLFHEMGHAVHSILGRTTMQGIAGTRCATDFAELPSVLMEYFATNASVLKLFARHWQTDQLIPDEMIATLHKERCERAERVGGWDNENQILMAILDQVYHSTDPVAALQRSGIESSTGAKHDYDTTAAYHHIWQTYGSAQEPSQTAWQGLFGHLYGYGATYYSYLFDRAIARQVWHSVFRNGEGNAAVSREGGERFKEEVLKWGGGRDPWICLEGLVGQGRGVLAEGGDEAMDLVGGWGVGTGEESD